MKNRLLNPVFPSVCALLSLASCGGKGAGDAEICHEGSRDNIEEVSAGIISIESQLPEMHSETAVRLAGDTLLFQDVRATDLQFTAYDIYEEKTLGRFGKYGNGPGEIANFGGVFYDAGTQTLYGANANQGKIMGFYLPEAIANPDYNSFDKFRMDFNGGSNAFVSPNYINDSTIICSVYVADGCTHIGKLSLVTQNVSLLDSAETDEKGRFGIAVSTERNLIFAADHLRDMVSIFNLDGKLLRRIYGPEYAEETDNKKRFFSGIVVCGDKVAIMYTGKEADHRNDKIIIMDMDGKYIKTLKFDFSVNSMAYHPKTDRLYLTTSGEPQFGYLNLN